MLTVGEVGERPRWTRPADLVEDASSDGRPEDRLARGDRFDGTSDLGLAGSLDEVLPLVRPCVWLAIVVAQVLYLTMLSDIVGGLVEVFTDEVHLTDEIPVAVLGLIWLVIGLRLRRQA